MKFWTFLRKTELRFLSRRSTLNECQHDKSSQSGQLEISLSGFSLKLRLQIVCSVKTKGDLLASKSDAVNKHLDSPVSEAEKTSVYCGPNTPTEDCTQMEIPLPAGLLFQARKLRVSQSEPIFTSNPTVRTNPWFLYGSSTKFFLYQMG